MYHKCEIRSALTVATIDRYRTLPGTEVSA